ncbi:MAG: hypothetical protein HS126_27595 [Anaerolineales bacterium]|nr:hypothetical protein [Anaerolineales bacterium]
MKKEQMQQEPLQILKGNFAPRKPIELNNIEEDLTTQFEREALKRLGGSIAFVSKKKFLYGMGKKNNEADTNSEVSDVSK